MRQVLQHRSFVWLIWLGIYAALLVAVTWGMRSARSWALNELATPAARQQWDEWKAENDRHREGDQPTVRRPIQSNAPPTLILLRDHWLVCWLGLAITGTVVYWSFAMMFTGALRRESGNAEPTLDSDLED